MLAKAADELSGQDPNWYVTPEEGRREEGSRLGEIQAMAWRQRRLLMILVATAAVIGLFITLLLVPQYEAQSTVRIDNESLQIVGGEDVNPVISAFDTDRYLNTQREVIGSRRMAYAVIDAARLESSPVALAGLGLEKLPVGKSAAEKETVRDALALWLQSKVSVEIPASSRIARIRFTARDPQLAALLANTYAQRLVAQNVRGRYDANAYARQILQDQVGQAQAALRRAELAAVDYSRNNRIIDATSTAQSDDTKDGSGGESRSITADSLSQLNQSYVQARRDRILAEARYRASIEVNPLELKDSRDSSVLQSLIAQRATALADLRQAQSRYVARAPQVAQTKARVAALTGQIDAGAERVRSALRQEFEITRQQEERLHAASSSSADESLAEQDRRVQLNLLSRDAQNLREQLRELQRRLSQVQSASDVAANNISVMDNAGVPTSPSSPNMPRNIMLSIAVGLMIGIALAVLREAFNDTLHSPEDAERKLGVPLLGTTPLVEYDSVSDSGGELAEAYYSIRFAVDFATMGDRPKVLQVTSSRPGEGKSTSSLAIARDFARIGRKVILVDADLRQPSLHKIAGLPNDVGFANVLMNTATVEGAVQKIEGADFDILTLGPIPKNPAQVLSGDNVKACFAMMSKLYDVVIVDSAPVMGLADAPLLANAVDYTILIVEGGRVHNGQARATVRRLRDAGANLVGIIMTKFDQRDAGYSYDYHYSYYDYGREAKA